MTSEPVQPQCFWRVKAPLPTEAGYEVVASALDAHAVAALSQLADSSAFKSIAVTLGDPQEALDWLPHLRGPAVRLARAFWPGPLTLVSPVSRQGNLWRLRAETSTCLASDGRLRIRIPDHPLSAIGRRLRGPMASTSLPNFPREVGQLTAYHDRLALIVNDGPSPLVEPTTVVAVNGRSATILRAGAVPRLDIDEALPCRILFVCTGNTCRSPLAEVLCRQLLSVNLGCAPGELAQHGYIVQSAGLAAAPGNRATDAAAAVAKSYGANLEAHRSRPLSLDLLSRAQFVFTMTGSQRVVLESLGLMGTQPQQLDPDEDDVDDPIGGDDAVYVACAQQLWQLLNRRLPELLES